MANIETIEEMKAKLQSYRRRHIRFNEPHFKLMIIMREGNRAEVIRHLLNPDNLVSFYTEKGSRGDLKYALYFRISNTRTMKIPVIFDINNRKSIYVLTYIMRYRPWQSMIKKHKVRP